MQKGSVRRNFLDSQTQFVVLLQAFLEEMKYEKATTHRLAIVDTLYQCAIAIKVTDKGDVFFYNEKLSTTRKMKKAFFLYTRDLENMKNHFTTKGEEECEYLEEQIIKYVAVLNKYLYVEE